MRNTLTVYSRPLLKYSNMDSSVITVKQLNTYVKSLIEGDARLNCISVSGEISNFKNHYSSGHWYFTLKDNDAQIRCVMFNSYASRVGFEVRDGIRVVLKGRVSIYERDGQYQFYAEELRIFGEGDLAVAFNMLKEKLESEGLFAAEHKRPLKKYPKKIAVLTSDTGAAVHDILNILSKRYPVCSVLLCPVTVQGDGAPESITLMLERVYARDDVDTIIIGRGGGSLEDLWAFNDERLARVLFSSPVPVISAVGHETDFTICDFVCDVRASTPSHAAELAVPDMSAILSVLKMYRDKLYNNLMSDYKLWQARYEIISVKPIFSVPDTYFDDLALKIDAYCDGLSAVILERYDTYEQRLKEQILRIDALSPLKTLSRGFAEVSSDSSTVKSVKQLSIGRHVSLRFADGSADCTVNSVRSKV